MAEPPLPPSPPGPLRRRRGRPPGATPPLTVAERKRRQRERQRLGQSSGQSMLTERERLGQSSGQSVLALLSLPTDVLLHIMVMMASPWKAPRVVRVRRAAHSGSDPGRIDALFTLWRVAKGWDARNTHRLELGDYIKCQRLLDKMATQTVKKIVLDERRTHWLGALVWGAPLARGRPLAADFELHVVLDVPSRNYDQYRVGRITNGGITNASIAEHTFHQTFTPYNMIVGPSGDVAQVGDEQRGDALRLLDYFQKCTSVGKRVRSTLKSGPVFF